ncbi:MAG TPA: radical SAM family heme chaperone HemW [Bacteroidetes bacterium]|nr:radical SAM family heme chaperone HemW [Bacteroidota bacterium]
MAGLYVHIPYCKRICNYCDFYRVVSSGSPKKYIESVISESKLRKGYIGDAKINTVYIGGGTPSTLSIKELSLLLESLRDVYQWDKEVEFTLEVNPDDITEIYLRSIKDLGINRISIGIQSWSDRILKTMNRRHNSLQAEKAINYILDAEFKNISVDLIYGVPGLTMEEWEETLRRTVVFDIQHLSVYHLTIEPDTVFGKMKKQGLLDEIEEEYSVAQYNLLLEITEGAGFINYEISNFGKEGFFSKHNTSYWQQIPYIGLGPSAHSFNGYSRQWNESDVDKYIEEIDNGRLPYEKEELDEKVRFNEYVMTSLRTMWGIDLDKIEEKFGKEILDYTKNLAKKYVEYGMMLEKKGNLSLTKQAIMVSDNIIAEFMLT